MRDSFSPLSSWSIPAANSSRNRARELRHGGAGRPRRHRFQRREAETMMDEDLFDVFTEKLACDVFKGRFPSNVSPQLLAVIILQSIPAFRDADIEVRKYFLARLVPLIAFRRVTECNADIADYIAEWKS
jgi:hypothetical protein